jgi:hypothetical protein
MQLTHMLVLREGYTLYAFKGPCTLVSLCQNAAAKFTKSPNGVQVAVVAVVEVQRAVKASNVFLQSDRLQTSVE